MVGKMRLELLLLPIENVNVCCLCIAQVAGVKIACAVKELRMLDTDRIACPAFDIDADPACKVLAEVDQLVAVGGTEDADGFERLVLCYRLIFLVYEVHIGFKQPDWIALWFCHSRILHFPIV